MTDHQLHPETWVETYGDLMMGYAYTRLKSRSIAEDVVQETLLGAYKSKDRYKGTHPEKAWLMGILKHKIVDHIRKAVRETVMENPEDAAAFDSPLYKYSGIPTMNPRPWQFDPSKAAEYSDFWPVFENCLSKLKPVQKAAFLLRELEGQTTEEICNELEISANNLCVIFHRARAQLKDCLERNWMEPDLSA